MDRMSEIQTFVQVAESGGIGAAADRLGVAKSAVSRRLKDLEERLGVRLVNRTTRQLSLTDTGKSYYERASQILADLEDADQTAAAVHGALSGRLKIAGPQSFGVLHLLPAVTSFLEKHPELWIDLDVNDRRVDVVNEGFDLAVRVGQLEDSSLIARRLAPVRNIVCASPGYLERHGTPKRPEDLMGHSYLRYSNVPERRIFSWIDEQGRERVVNPKARFVANNGEILQAAAEAGLGIISQPTFLIHKAVEEGRLVPILTDIEWWQLGAYALYPPGRHLSAKVRAFVDHLVSCFGDPPYWDERMPISRGKPVHAI
ncbi:LysR family transcriptional regulator [Microbaculum marinum]|uniref:LysR family transcriptional regulator n=1 Tax=Microbaculum marinum TaxID=1764581 RepID=A0AAW9RTI9_9HYPH